MTYSIYMCILHYFNSTLQETCIVERSVRYLIDRYLLCAAAVNQSSWHEERCRDTGPEV